MNSVYAYIAFLTLLCKPSIFTVFKLITFQVVSFEHISAHLLSNQTQPCGSLWYCYTVHHHLPQSKTHHLHCNLQSVLLVHIHSGCLEAGILALRCGLSVLCIHLIHVLVHSLILVYSLGLVCSLDHCFVCGNHRIVSHYRLVLEHSVGTS